MSVTPNGPCPLHKVYLLQLAGSVENERAHYGMDLLLGDLRRRLQEPHLNDVALLYMDDSKLDEFHIRQRMLFGSTGTGLKVLTCALT